MEQKKRILPKAPAAISAYIAGFVGVVGLLVAAYAHTFGVASLFGGVDAFIVGACLMALSIAALLFEIIRFARERALAERIAEIMKDRSDRFARAAFGSHEGLWDIDVESREAFFSHGWHAMLGFAEEKVRTIDDWTALIHPEDRPLVLDALAGCAHRLQLYYEAEYRIKNARGTYVWLSDRGSTTMEFPGRIAGFSRNISREKSVEEALRSRTEELRRAKEDVEKEIYNTKKFSQAVDAATDPIAIITAAGNIMYANPARFALMGVAVRDMIGAHILAPYRDAADRKDIEAFEAALRAGRAFTSENFIGIRANGTRFEAALSLFPVREKGSIAFFTTLEQDITKRKEIDRAKTEFVSLASHQLRTPLTAIRWYSETLLKERERPLTASERKYVHEIYDANRRMIELIGALLNVSRIDLGAFSVNPEPTDLVALFESVLGETRPFVATKGIVVERAFSESAVIAPVDPQLFRMVFQNLVSNAAKYTPSGGRIRVALARDGANVTFSVADTGIGIPAADQEKIFSKMFRADNARDADPDGTGLGLYIVKAIMETSGGSIRFESHAGRGTTFYGTIPADGSRMREGLKTLQTMR